MKTEEKEEAILFEIAVTSSFKKDKKKLANNPLKIEKLLSLIYYRQEEVKGFLPI